MAIRRPGIPSNFDPIADMEAFLDANPLASGELGLNQPPGDSIYQLRPPPTQSAGSTPTGPVDNTDVSRRPGGTEGRPRRGADGFDEVEHKELGPVSEGGPVEGVSSTGYIPEYNPWNPPLGPDFTNEDLNLWLAQFPKGSPEYNNAIYAMDHATGSGQFSDRTWNVETQSYDEAPAGNWPTSDLGDVVQMPDGTFRVVPSGDIGLAEGEAPADTGTSDTGQSGEDVIAAVEGLFNDLDIEGTLETERANTATLLADQAADFSSQMDRMMAIISGLQNPRKEDERSGSLAYAPLYGGY